VTVVVETPRLQLLAPAPEHRAALGKVFGDAEAMRFIGDGTAWSDERIDLLLDKMMTLQSEHGFSLWPVARRDDGDVIGDCGLCFIRHSDSGAFGPEIEVGYHLRRDVWGRGYASEAAAAALAYARDELALRDIIAVVQPDNRASQRVLEKVGMRREGETDRYYDRRLVLFSS
jgi:RimJ/RimL family protein N-acetyltransferase